MALYVNTSRFCTARSLSNPGSFGLPRFSVSTDNSRSIRSLSNFIPLHSSKPRKHASKKALTFASLSLTGNRTIDNHCSDASRGGTYARSSSLFLPNSGPKTHDLAPATQPLAGTILAMSKTLLPEDPIPNSIPPISANPDAYLTTNHDSSSKPQMTDATSSILTCLRSPPPPASPFLKSTPIVYPSLDFSSSVTLPSPMLPSPTARSRRAVSPSDSPPMHVLSSSSQHTLDVYLPPMIQPEMVTISVKRGDKLEIIADAWHMEADCHYEWQISFAPHDIDMSSVQAKFDPDGHLTINVRRRPLDYTVFHY